MPSFRVNSIPVAQPRQRHRVLTVAGKSFAQNYTPTKAPVNVFKAAVQAEAAKAFPNGPMEGPVHLAVIFIMPRPQSMRWAKREMVREWHAKKPDAENLCKSLMDAMTGYCFVDDCQVVILGAQKLIASGDESPHVEVEVRSLHA